MKIKVDQEMADIIFKKTLVDYINMQVTAIRDLLEKETLKQYEIIDLRNDRMYLTSLINIYDYTNIDGDRWDNCKKEFGLTND